MLRQLLASGLRSIDVNAAQTGEACRQTLHMYIQKKATQLVAIACKHHREDANAEEWCHSLTGGVVFQLPYNKDDQVICR